MADRNFIVQLLITARDQASDIVGRIRAGLGGVGDAASAALSPLRSFWGLVGAGLGIAGAKELADYADAYTRLSNSLKVATKSHEEFQAAEQTVIRIAAETRSGLETTAQLYARINQNRKAMNVTEKETASLTELISKGMQLGGASAQEYASATLQLTQAFGSGVLRGEEFNAVMEASPELMRQLAAGLGIAVGELRGLAEQGVLTSTVVAKALLSQKDAIDAAYSKTTQTVEQSFEQLKNASVLFVGKLNEQTGATKTAGEGLAFLARNLDLVASLMGAAVAASFAKFTQGAAQAVTASLAAREAAREHALAEAARQREILATAQANAAAAQGAYNRALAEQRLAQQIVTAMQAELGYGVTDTELAAARTRSAAAAQAATAATERYAAAQAALNAVQAPAAAGAGLFGRALGFLAGPGGLILTAVAAMGLLYSSFSKQKKPTDDLTQSTEQYTESLKRMSTAQAQVELNKVNDALAEQRQRVQEAKEAYDQVASSERGWITVTEDLGPIFGKVNRVISDANEIARIRAARHAELDAATQQLAATEERRAAAQKTLADKQRISNEMDAKQLAQYIQTGLAAQQLSGNIEKLTKYQEELSGVEQKRLESQIALAEANGDYVAAETAAIALAKERSETAKQQAVLDEAAAQAAKLRVTSLENEYKAYTEISPVQAKALTDARQDAALKQKQAEASAALSAQLGKQAQQTENTHAAQQKMLALVDQFRAAQTQAATADLAAAKASLELAKAKGDEQATLEALVVVKQKEVIEAQRATESNKANLQQLLAQRQALIDQAGGIEKLTAAQRTQIGTLDQYIEVKKKDIQTSETDIAIKQREAQQAAIMAGPIGQLTRLYTDQAKEHERAADASEQYYSVQLKEIEGALKIAQAKGDENAVMALQAKQQKILIEQAEALAAAKATEAADAQKAVDAKTLELAADGELSKADKEQIADLEALAKQKQAAAQEANLHAEALQKEADALKSVNDGSKAFDNAAQNAYKFSDAAADVARRNKEVSESAEKAMRSMEGVNVTMAKFGNQSAIAFGDAGVRQFEGIIRDIKGAIDEAVTATDRLANEGLLSVGINASDAALYVDNLANSLEKSESYLNDAARAASENLRQALADARAEAEAMVQSLAEAADATEKEILRLQGRNKEILEIEHREKLQQLEAEYQRAGELGEAEYRRAKAAQEALYALKLKQLQEQAETDKKTTTTSNTSGSGSSTGSTSSTSGSGGKSGDTINNFYLTGMATGDFVRRELLPEINKVANLRR